MSAAFAAPSTAAKCRRPTRSPGARCWSPTACAVAGGRFAVVLNLAMPSCDGYSGRYVPADGSIPCGFGQALTSSPRRD